MASDYVVPQQRTDAPHWAERVVRLLDDGFVIPGTSRRIGIDPLLGLVPGGDAVSAAATLSLFYLALQRGVPRAVLAQMAANVAVDTLIGSVPVIGDLFDFGYKANRRNLQLIERVTVPGLRRDKQTRTIADYVAISLIVLMVLAAVTLPFVIVWLLAKFFWNAQ